MIDSLLKYAAMAAVPFAIFGAGWWAGTTHTKAEYAVKVEQARSASALENFRLHERVSNVIADSTSRLQAADANYAALAASLQSRPDRAVPGPTRAACTGATGAELSRRDAGFLARYYSSYSTVTIKLQECRQAYEEARASAAEVNKGRK